MTLYDRLRERSMKHIAVVTGASSGVGREFVNQLDKGAWGYLDEIWVLARRAGELEELSAETSTPVRVFAVDITDLDQLEEYRTALAEERPSIRYLINSAGMGTFGRIRREKLDNLTGMVDLNARALVEMTYISLPYVERGSCIINMSSAIAFIPQPQAAVYQATKRFVFDFSRSLHYDLEDVGISVTAACPKAMHTEFFDEPGDKRAAMSMKVLGVESPKRVVKRALKDVNSGKDVSISSKTVKLFRLKRKMLPLSVFMKLQKLTRMV